MYKNPTISMLLSIDCQLSDMSLVVLQLLPTWGAQRAGESTPHSKYKIVYNIEYSRKIGQFINIPHMEKKIGLPVAFNASLIGGYRTSGLVPLS